MNLVGERKACAAAVMAFYGTIYLLNALVGPPAFMPMLVGMALAYMTGFFGLVAGYFWARWYTLGIAISGVIIAIMLWWQIGFETIVIIIGATHGLAALALAGTALQPSFDGRKDWREKYRLDDNGANRLGKAIMRAGASLPYLIMAGLAPRQGQGMGMLALVCALGLGVVGLHALIKLRTWGVLALAAGALFVAAGQAETSSLSMVPMPVIPLGGALLLAAAAPFAAPIGRALRGG